MDRTQSQYVEAGNRHLIIDFGDISRAVRRTKNALQGLKGSIPCLSAEIFPILLPGPPMNRVHVVVSGESHPEYSKDVESDANATHQTV